ncbi:YifB family Mg chelatase-like AAA ATPase [Hydrogenovibrio sp. 3SP14C1]|uniref:YifB family Mg chelatase-like AAA ATPase n=1 Tax=Hydrogenovibrio sp. 3SP14C1 TaxID=3038774 RepID=UPI0024169B6D|nr:YifB family Mg chelatase-like AAA ATPase [Hydrogenovibrio sp. 3SP14C1]MDG4813225.1 YifB family Mg chelatase-like AAA ATPase [Hydrogenovibrio sp. 3SP14C1]
MASSPGQYATILSRAVSGVQAPEVQVEVHSTNGLPSLSIVGLPEASVKESRDRVRSALLSSGFSLPPKRITINLAPADIPKQGGRYDLPIALGILKATGQLTPIRSLDSFEFLGELALNGEIRPVPGVLPALIQAEKKSRTVIVPTSNLVEASFADVADVYGAETLLDVCQFLMSSETFLPKPDRLEKTESEYLEDISDIRGQFQAKRLLEVCASGGHSLLMVGPPGSGKSMLASRLVTLLPELDLKQAIDVASIHSVAGKTVSMDQFFQRTLVQPHHTATAAAMVGGGSGSFPKPGAISLAHHSILFLDELPEFNRSVLEALREPLETRKVEIARVNQKVTYPAAVQLVCAMNPTPSGYFPDDPMGRCQDTPEQVLRYRRKISGPLLDRIDCHLEVPPVDFEALSGEKEIGAETSSVIRERVQACQRIQKDRQGCLNTELSPKQLEQFVLLQPASKALLEQAVNRMGMSARGYHRILRVARTLADMQQQENVLVEHVAESISYRSLDKSL